LSIYFKVRREIGNIVECQVWLWKVWEVQEWCSNIIANGVQEVGHTIRKESLSKGTWKNQDGQPTQILEIWNTLSNFWTSKSKLFQQQGVEIGLHKQYSNVLLKHPCSKSNHGTEVYFTFFNVPVVSISRGGCF